MKQILPIIMLLALCVGCQTNLEKGGVYDGDEVLFRAEQSIVETKQAMDTFLIWEENNKVALAKYPEIKKYADIVRVDGRVWIESAMHLRDAYKFNPTDENRTKLQTSLALLRTMLAEIAIHLARTTESTKTINR